MEIWKDIKGYEGAYQVSDYGNIKSLSREVKNGKGVFNSSEINLKIFNDRNNYKVVFLSKNNNRKTMSLHRIVAKAFLKNKENKREVNHIDGDKSNNKADNLEWCTPSENMIHAYKNGLMIASRGEKQGGSKLKDNEVIEIRNKYTGKHGDLTRLSKEYNVSLSSISGIVNHKSWKHLIK